VSETAYRDEICEAGRRLYQRNLIAAADGNISVRLDEDRFLITPSGVSKGFLEPEMILVANGRGERLEGEGKVSSEFFTHLAAYEEREDIHAVIHAHPPYSVALTLVGISMARPVLPEVVASLGGVPTAAYATPGTREGADVLRPHVQTGDAILLDRHGAVTVGNSVQDALFKMERVEHAAEMIYRAYCISAPLPLDSSQIERLLQARAAYGASGRLGAIQGYPPDSDAT